MSSRYRRGPNDARLWGLLADQFHQAGAAYPDDAHRHARIAVAIVRRERTTTGARTWAPGDSIPYDVAKAYDLDGDLWERQSTDPESTLRDSWKMRPRPGGDYVDACRGVWITPFLLDSYGPLTEVGTTR